jgi:outer membrane protein OmpA-like peptidoglycan-associated protein
VQGHVAKDLQKNADNKLVIVGNADPTETRSNLAAERAVNSKAYLISGEAQLGIDPSRIETRTVGTAPTTCPLALPSRKQARARSLWTRPK